MPFDCTTCGACCREAFDAVEIAPDDPFVRLHPALVIQTPFGKTAVRRKGSRCACLVGGEDAPYHCTVYAQRPQTCRDVEVGGEACLWARARLGLPTRPHASTSSVKTATAQRCETDGTGSTG